MGRPNSILDIVILYYSFLYSLLIILSLLLFSFIISFIEIYPFNPNFFSLHHLPSVLSLPLPAVCCFFFHIFILFSCSSLPWLSNPHIKIPPVIKPSSLPHFFCSYIASFCLFSSLYRSFSFLPLLYINLFPFFLFFSFSKKIELKSKYK